MASLYYQRVRSQQGVSLVGVLVALAIMGTLAAVLMSFSKNAIEAWQSVRHLNSKEEIRQLVRTKLDCTAALAVARTCTGASLNIALNDKFGRQMIAATTAGTRVGTYSMRAECATQSGIYRLKVKSKSGPWENLYATLDPCLGPLP